jgi:hypothetical protein
VTASRRHPPTVRHLARLARAGVHRELVWSAALAPVLTSVLLAFAVGPALLHAGQRWWQCALHSSSPSLATCAAVVLQSPPTSMIVRTLVSSMALAIVVGLAATLAAGSLRQFVRIREPASPRWLPHLWLGAALLLSWLRSWPHPPSIPSMTTVIATTVAVDLLTSQLRWRRASRMSDDERRQEAREQLPSPRAQRLLRNSMGSRPTRDPSHQ